MAEHLVTILENESAHARASIPDTAKLVADRAAYVEALRATGAYLDGGRFRPSSEGVRVRRDGEHAVIDAGPFEGDVIASYLYVEAPTLDAATEIARGFPRAEADTIDVRPPMKANMRPGKDALTGKVFAFAVLGSASSEEAWTSVMDRIDAETRDAFSADVALGGLRLEPPKRGRRVTSANDGGLVLDGPFLESKEMIGGLFFLRGSSLDEAIAWAKESAFVRHGTLEIRELWRA